MTLGPSKDASPQWADPPEPRWGSGTPWTAAALAEQIKARPGRWALVDRDGRTQISGRAIAWRRHGFEITTRLGDGDDGVVDMYARWPAGEEA